MNAFRRGEDVTELFSCCLGKLLLSTHCTAAAIITIATTSRQGNCFSHHALVNLTILICSNFAVPLLIFLISLSTSSASGKIVNYPITNTTIKNASLYPSPVWTAVIHFFPVHHQCQPDTPSL